MSKVLVNVYSGITESSNIDFSNISSCNNPSCHCDCYAGSDCHFD